MEKMTWLQQIDHLTAQMTQEPDPETAWDAYKPMKVDYEKIIADAWRKEFEANARKLAKEYQQLYFPAELVPLRDALAAGELKVNGRLRLITINPAWNGIVPESEYENFEKFCRRIVKFKWCANADFIWEWRIDKDRRCVKEDGLHFHIQVELNPEAKCSPSDLRKSITGNKKNEWAQKWLGPMSIHIKSLKHDIPGYLDNWTGSKLSVPSLTSVKEKVVHRETMGLPIQKVPNVVE